MSSDKVNIKNVGIVGFGSIGRRYANLLHEMGLNVLIYSVGKSLLLDAEAKEKFTIINEERVFWHSSIEAVIICNPSFLHLEWLEKSLSNGLPVFCEKPIHISHTGLKQLTHLIDNKCMHLANGCGYMWRYETGINKLKQLIKSIDPYSICSVQMEMGTFLPDWHPWEDYQNSYAANSEMGGGIVLTCSHEVDTLLYLFGELDVLASKVRSNSSLNTNTEDCVDAFLVSKEGGFPIHLSMNWFQKKGYRRLKILTEKQRIDWCYDYNEIKITDNFTAKTITETYHSNIDQAYKDMIAEFVKSINEKTAVRCTLSDAIETLKPCLEILKID